MTRGRHATRPAVRLTAAQAALPVKALEEAAAYRRDRAGACCCDCTCAAAGACEAHRPSGRGARQGAQCCACGQYGPEPEDYDGPGEFTPIEEETSELG
ncbi:MAG TPA: hypothetical protein VKV80_16355 [Streptosporangiaceae bacterium]|nr:hypothetical protein [Streptosporangiaceae bacterium]